jgi:hypothetical protein
MSLTAGAAAIGTVAAVLVATPAAALAGLVVVTGTTVGPVAGGLHTALVTCPAGSSRAVGGGGRLLGSDHVRLDAVIPEPDGRSMFVAGIGAGNTVTTALTSYAICVSSAPGYELVQTESRPPAGSAVAEVWVACPAGKKVIGAGGNSAGERSYVLDAIFVASNLSGVYVRTVQSPDASPDVAPLARAHAICVTPVFGQQRVTARTDPSQASSQSISKNCPPGSRLHGVGGIIGGGGGHVGFELLQPLGPNGASAKAVAAEGYGGAWNVELHLICVTGPPVTTTRAGTGR